MKINAKAVECLNQEYILGLPDYTFYKLRSNISKI